MKREGAGPSWTHLERTPDMRTPTPHRRPLRQPRIGLAVQSAAPRPLGPLRRGIRSRGLRGRRRRSDGRPPGAPGRKLGAESVVVTSTVGSADYIALGGWDAYRCRARRDRDQRDARAGGVVVRQRDGHVEVLSASRLRLNFGDGPVLLDYALNGDVLTFTGPGEIDVDDDGVEDPVTLEARLRRE